MENMRLRLGFVPTYRTLFEKAFTPWCEKMREGCLTSFSSIKNLELVVPKPSPDNILALDATKGYSPYGAISTLDQAETVAKYFSHENIDGLIICALDFGDERSVAKIAEKFNVPILLFGTKEPPITTSPSLHRVSDSYCGTLAIAAALHRRNIAFQYAGIFMPDDPELITEIKNFIRVTAIVKELKNARIGHIGVRPDPFESMGYNETALIQKFGQNVIYGSLSDIVEKAHTYKVTSTKVKEVIANVRNTVHEVTVAETYLNKAARLELALTEFWKEHKLSALALQCWPTIINLLGLNVCAVLGRLTGQHMLTACESDVLGAISMLVSYSAALGTKLPHFVDWTMQHKKKPNWLLAWHCGNAPVCLAADPKKTALRSRMDMQGELPVKEDDISAGLYQFQIKQGYVTFCRIAEYSGIWKMLIASGKIVTTSEIQAGTWAWVEVNNHMHLYRTLVEHGFTQHASMIHDNQVDILQKACEFLDICPVIVE